MVERIVAEARVLAADLTREFLDMAFAQVGIVDWSKRVAQGARFFRPAEVDLLISDATKATEKLSWTPRVTFPRLVDMMVGSDLGKQKTLAAAAAAAATGPPDHRAGHRDHGAGRRITDRATARAPGHTVHGFIQHDDELADDVVARYLQVELNRGELDDQHAVRATLDAVAPDLVFLLAGSARLPCRGSSLCSRTRECGQQWHPAEVVWQRAQATG